MITAQAQTFQMNNNWDKTFPQSGNVIPKRLHSVTVSESHWWRTCTFPRQTTRLSKPPKPNSLQLL